MSGHNCDPCSRMGSNCPALQWCSSCNELLCTRCYNYHKVLGVTKDHTAITVEEYEAILPFIASVQMKCREHTNKEYNFEAEIKHELTQNFDSEKNRLLVRRNDYLQKMDEIKKEKHIISNVANIEIKSNKHLFLLQGQMNDKLKLKESAVKDLITPLEDVSLECNVDLDIDMHSGCLMLTRTVAFHRSPSEIDLEVLHIESESETTEIMEDDKIQ
ncbi:unnamed protein product [Mytilus edulis]|uniref:B box-type domain-containing protein n=1 Tax=Mytilus edulis TaxID=6550 RepID=A0A8S3TFR1_MYTED|nr:unnamed protein product [Mytilus edulis]